MTVEPIFRARSYDELRLALNMRRQQLGMSMEVLSENAGLQPGYAGKIFGGRRMKNLGPLSLTLLLDALGCELALMPIDRAAAAMDDERNRKLLAFLAYYRELGRKGGRITRARLSDFRRHQNALKAGRANRAKWLAIKAEKREARP
jgi:transcriptional regulator with XRE-family HTH domain